MKIVTLLAAREAGLKRYFTGQRCKHGHLSERRTSDSICVECQRARCATPEYKERGRVLARKRYHLDADKMRAAQRRNRAANPERTRVVGREGVRRRKGLPSPTRPPPSACECCGKSPSDGKILNLDHCHDTGIFRGWLCAPCNLGLGLLGDSAQGVRRALAYLEAHS